MSLAPVLLLLLAACLSAQHSELARPPGATRASIINSVSHSNPPAPNATWLDTTSRAAIATSYLTTFVPTSSIPTGWTGNVTAGDPGSTSQAYKDAVLTRINWYRQLAGVPTPVTFLDNYSASDQEAALMMSANGQLNHMPPSDWLFFTTAGAQAAAQSNLCMNIPYLNDPGCIAQYMQDAGATNTDAGHRRWLLYPQTRNMGTGDVQPPYPQAFVNALWVVDTRFRNARPATRDPFVAWPPSGYVPYQVVPGRWSFSYAAADFTNASVTMQRGGGAVAVRLESPSQGFGENSVVWVPDNIDANSATHWPLPSVDTPISVTVSHVSIAGVDTTFNYTVTVIDPSSGINIGGHITRNGAALQGVAVSLSGGPSATTDIAGAYAFASIPAGTYLLVPTLSGNAFSPSSRSVSASTASADFTAAVCDYSGIGGNLTLSANAGAANYRSAIAGGCPWSAVSGAPWLTVSPTTASGTGPIAIDYSWTANTGALRSTVLTVAGRAVTVTQPSSGQSSRGPINVGFFLRGLWAIDSNNSGVFDAGDKYFNFQIYGDAGDKPIVGDWNGDGHQKAGIFHDGFWALDYNGNGRWDGSAVDRFYAFGGNPGEIPLVGDWNGDGRTKIGYYLHGFWALDYNGNGQWDGPVIDRFIALGGNPGETPIVGDWNGDGRAKVGFFVGGTWVLDYNGNGQWDGSVIDRYYTYSSGAGERPVVGDWNGSGTTKIGVWRNGFWALNVTGTGAYQAGVDLFHALGGNPGEVPIVGDWNGDGKSKIGFYFNGFWALDFNGNGRWDGTGVNGDRFIALGGNPGEQPVLGKW